MKKTIYGFRALFVPLLLALVTTLSAVPQLTAKAASGRMTITAIDLRGGNSGEATMISADDGTPLLVDSGDNCNRAVFDWLSDNGYGSKAFNTLVTHWHDDHAGNTAEIIRKYNVRTVYLPATNYLDIVKSDYYRYEKSYATDILNAARARGTRVVYLKKGAVIKIGTGVSGEVLYVNGSPITESNGALEHINNQSAAIMFTGGDCRFLTAGDLSEKGEERLLKSGENLKADIFKMSHHGYDSSSTWGFINAVKPTYAWYTSNSVSTEKFTSALTRTASNRMSRIANTFSTRYNGTIRFVCSNGEIKVSAERNTAGMYEKLTNKATGKVKYVTYTFNDSCDVHMSQKIVNTDRYYNMQLKASESGDLFTGSWLDEDVNKYLVKGNIRAFHTFAKKSGKTYYFDWSGRRRTGFINAYGGKYYFGPSMVTGWKVVNGRRYFFMNSKYSNYSKAKEGQMLTGFKKISGKDYYFMNAGCGSYKAAARGKLMTGFFTVNGKKYYGTNTKMKGYQAADLGVLAKGWATINNNLYFFGTDHVMRTGWLRQGGKVYYLFAGGSAAVNRFVTISGRKYYFDASGVMQTGWQTIDGEKYYFDENGVMQTGEQRLGRKVFVFGEDGALLRELEAENVNEESATAGTTQMAGTTEIASEEEPGTEGAEAAVPGTEDPGTEDPGTAGTQAAEPEAEDPAIEAPETGEPATEETGASPESIAQEAAAEGTAGEGGATQEGEEDLKP